MKEHSKNLRRAWKRVAAGRRKRDLLRERYSTANGWDYLGNGAARRLRLGIGS